MFLKGSLFNICIIKVILSVEWFFNSTREDYFLYLFDWVRLEIDFLLSCPVINLLQVFNKVIRRGI